LRDKGLKRHLAELGINYDVFCEYVEDGLKPASLRLIFKKSDGKFYARTTVAGWVRLYKEERAQEPNKSV
jgi:hypothetical protein